MIRKKIQENFNLTAGELDIILNNPGKGEGIFRVGDSSVWIQTDPSDKEMMFIESNEAVLQELFKQYEESTRVRRIVAYLCKGR